MMNLADLDGRALLEWFLGAPLRVLAILVIAIVLRSLAVRAISRAMSRIANADLIPGKNRSLSRQRERAHTAGTVLKSITNTLIALVAVSTILSEAGMDLAPLIASVRTSLKKNSPMRSSHDMPNIVAAKLGNNAGIVGVADLARIA
jgi:small-conductance mechanosensitive channel